MLHPNTTRNPTTVDEQTQVAWAELKAVLMSTEHRPETEQGLTELRELVNLLERWET